MNRKENYRDLDKWRKTCNRQMRRYYAKSQCGRHPLEPWQDELVLKHEITDPELSKKIGHSVQAIQIRRHMLRRRET